jgi:hypothetical protein
VVDEQSHVNDLMPVHSVTWKTVSAERAWHSNNLFHLAGQNDLILVLACAPYISQLRSVYEIPSSPTVDLASNSVLAFHLFSLSHM